MLYKLIVERTVYIENYNLFLKKNLGKKYDLNWDLFINFLKKESSRIRDKLTVGTDKNIIHEAKKNKIWDRKVFRKKIIG